jgi:hypothetical protein
MILQNSGASKQSLQNLRSAAPQKNVQDWISNISGIANLFPEVHIAADLAKQVRVVAASSKLINSALKNSGISNLNSSRLDAGSQKKSASGYQVQQKKRSIDRSEDQRSSTLHSEQNVNQGVGRTSQKLAKGESLGKSRVLGDSSSSNVGSYKGLAHEMLRAFNLQHNAKFMDIHGMKISIDRAQDDARISTHEKSAGALSKVHQSAHVSGFKPEKLHSLGMVNSVSSPSSKGLQGSSLRSSIGTSHPRSDWRGLFSAILCIVDSARGVQVCERNSKVFGTIIDKSASKIHGGTCGHFLRADWAVPISVDSMIRIQPSMDSRIRFQNKLKEAIGWRKHIFDRG